MASLSRPKKLPLREQLTNLASLGICITSDASDADWESFYPISEYETPPYFKIIEVLGCEIQRDSFLPICSTFWMCDFERIDGHGSYEKIVSRLQLMSGNVLNIKNMSDHVDFGAGVASIEFRLNGKNVHWELKVEDDWLDPQVVVKFDAMLRANANLRIYSNTTDYGECALLACMLPHQFARFRALSRVNMFPIHEDA
jgi:hypothetical protein